MKQIYIGTMTGMRIPPVPIKIHHPRTHIHEGKTSGPCFGVPACFPPRLEVGSTLIVSKREQVARGRRRGVYRYCSSSEGAAQRSRELLVPAKMPAAMVDATTANFDAMLAVSEVQGDGLLLLLFLGDRDTQLGRSWCPDCVRAEPVIYSTLESSDKKTTLLRVYVGDRTTWRKSSHPLRMDPRFLLKGVPTLIRWEDGKITGRLEDNEAHVEDKIKKLIS